MKILASVLVLTLTACMTANYAHWPYRGPMLMVENPTGNRMIVRARDGAGREWVTASIKAHGKSCFRWPFIHTVGYLIAAGADTLVSQAFEPWTADGWQWSGAPAPVANPNVCR